MKYLKFAFFSTPNFSDISVDKRNEINVITSARILRCGAHMFNVYVRVSLDFSEQNNADSSETSFCFLIKAFHSSSDKFVFIRGHNRNVPNKFFISFVWILFILRFNRVFTTTIWWVWKSKVEKIMSVQNSSTAQNEKVWEF